MGMTVNPLSPILGAEVTSLDLSQPLGENLFSEVRQSWLEAGEEKLIGENQVASEPAADPVEQPGSNSG